MYLYELNNTDIELTVVGFVVGTIRANKHFYSGANQGGK